MTRISLRARSAAFAVLALVLVATSVVTVLGFSVAPGATPSCGATTAAPAAHSPVRHLFFLIKENHALENYFGNLTGVRGYPPNGSYPAAFGSTAVVHPFPLANDSTPDLPHDRATELVDLDGGKNDLFVAEAAAEGYSNAADAAGYYSSTQIPDYYAYAHYYTLDDMFFSGVLGPTLPNRLFDLGLTGSTWATNDPPPASAVDGPTLPGQFASAGLPWEYFYSGPNLALPPSFVPQIARDPCLASHVQPLSELGAALAGPAPPALAYIDPENDPLYSEHPPSNVTLGSEWTAAVLNAIFQSPIGNSSAVFLFYDEAGGFADPIAPPTAPPLGDGFRVPLLVLSPWTPAGEISHQLLDPANLMRWAETNWALPPLTPRLANASLPIGLFNFSAPARSALILPTPIAPSGVVGPLRGGAAPTGLGKDGVGVNNVRVPVTSGEAVGSCDVPFFSGVRPFGCRDAPTPPTPSSSIVARVSDGIVGSARRRSTRSGAGGDRAAPIVRGPGSLGGSWRRRRANRARSSAAWSSCA